MSIASKLKDLVIKWGGQPTKDDDSIEELIALLTELDAPGGSGALVVNLVNTGDGYVCDKTAGEMFEAMEQSGIVIKRIISSSGSIFYNSIIAANHAVDGYIFADSNNTEYQALSADDYPTTSGR